jgi:hypothetical protein
MTTDPLTTLEPGADADGVGEVLGEAEGPS